MTVQVPGDKFRAVDVLQNGGAVQVDVVARMGKQNLETLRGLAALHISYGQIANAEKFLLIALWAHPKDGPSQRLMAHVYARSGQPKRAVDLMLAASKSPDVKLKIGDWKEMGLAFLRQRNLRVGLKLLSRG